MEGRLTKAEQQLDLIPAEEVDEFVSDQLERRGDFTGERLFNQNPKVYQAIVKMIGAGMGVNFTASTLGVSTNTIQAVELRERSAVETLKKRTAGKALSVSRMCFEEMAERLTDPIQRAKIPFKDLAVGGGIAATKSIELAGDYVPTMESTDFKAGVDAFNGFIAAMGSMAETAAQKGADPVAQAKPIVDLDTAAPDSETDAYGSKT